MSGHELTCCEAARTCAEIRWTERHEMCPPQSRDGFTIVVDVRRDSPCGAELERGAISFCPFCGARVGSRPIAVEELVSSLIASVAGAPSKVEADHLEVTDPLRCEHVNALGVRCNRVNDHRGFTDHRFEMPDDGTIALLLAEARAAGYNDALQKHIAERNAMYSAHELGALADQLDEDNYATAAKKLRAAIATIARLEANAAEHPAVALLREIEWRAQMPHPEHEGSLRSICVACWQFSSVGHRPVCRLAAILAGSKPEECALPCEHATEVRGRSGRRIGWAVPIGHRCEGKGKVSI